MLRGILILALALGVRGDPASAAPEGCSSFSVSGALLCGNQPPDYLLWKCSADPDWIEVFPGIEPEQYECTCPGNRRKLRFGYSAEVGCCIDLNKIEWTQP